MAFNRRAVFQLLSAGAFAPALLPFIAIGDAMAGEAYEKRVGDEKAHARLQAIPDLKLYGNEQIAMLLYPGFTALDLVGPHYMFASMMGAQVHLVTPGPDLAPVVSDLGLAIAPTMRLEECPRELDVLFAPGGLMGTLEAMKDERIVSFLADRGSRARHVTSVCTGSLILGQAGLLRGKKATSHWATIDTLPAFGATIVNERVVTDGKLMTAAGVSAGLDFGLTLIGRLRGDNYARTIQLQAEYAPAPPFNAGTLDAAPQEVSGAMGAMLAPFKDMVRTVARNAR